MANLQGLEAEPEIQELMNDPIVRLLMKKDGVRQESLLKLLETKASNHNSVLSLQ